MLLPLITEGWLTRALMKRQKFADCPHALPAKTQMLYPEAPAGGGETNVTVTVAVAVCTGLG